MEFALLGLGLAWDPSHFLFFPISLFWNGNVYPVPVPPLYLAYNLSGFTGSSRKGIVPQDVSSLSDLDDI